MSKPEKTIKPLAISKKPSAKKLATLSHANKSHDLQPHEWLCRIAQGHPVEQNFEFETIGTRGELVKSEVRNKIVYPSFAERFEAAKAAAPYYAARLSKTDLKAVVSLEDLIAKSMEAAP